MDKISALRELFDQSNIDGYIIPSNDEFQNEYTPKHAKRLEWLTNFSGSNGVAIIAREKAVLFTDGRYLTQAKKQLPKEFMVLDMHAKPSCAWFEDRDNMVFGYDPMLHGISNFNYYQKMAKAYNFKLKPIEENLVSKIWKEAPLPSLIPAEVLGLEYAGAKAEEKIAKVVTMLQDDVDALLIAAPECVCWLLNIRGHDIPYTPFLLSYVILHKDGSLILFAKKEQCQEIAEHMPSNATIEGIERLRSYILELSKQGKKIQADPTFTPVYFQDKLGQGLVIAQDPCLMLKACKDEVEVAGIRKAHVEDGVALCKFLYWLSNNYQGLTEIEAAEKLLEFRKARDLFRYPSFETISAVDQNSAIIHYAPKAESTKRLEDGSWYLLDSGGQYVCGTTDVTRTMCFRAPSVQEKRMFTLVLKGHINLATVVFPEGTTGVQLDALARLFLWQHGADYQHGTGHGVGHFLSVHEGPQRLTKSSTLGAVPLKAGMVLSNEPGYYEEYRYGIRIESLLLVVPAVPGFLKFETLTLVPIDMNLVEMAMLSQAEKDWMQTYNARVYDALGYALSDEESRWFLGYYNKNCSS